MGFRPAAGIYVVFFFVVAQLISWLFFGQPPTTRGVLLGGAFIVTGGVIMTAWPH